MLHCGRVAVVQVLKPSSLALGALLFPAPGPGTPDLGRADLAPQTQHWVQNEKETLSERCCMIQHGKTKPSVILSLPAENIKKSILTNIFFPFPGWPCFCWLNSFIPWNLNSEQGELMHTHKAWAQEAEPSQTPSARADCQPQATQTAP